MKMNIKHHTMKKSTYFFYDKATQQGGVQMHISCKKSLKNFLERNNSTAA